MTWLEAQSVSEGFNVAGSRPARNNNPINMRWGPEAERFGATHGDVVSNAPGSYKGYSGFAVYPDRVTGWKAAQRWESIPAVLKPGPIAGFWMDPNGTCLVGGYLGATLAQVCYRFAPPEDGNNTEAYITGTCGRSGTQRTDILTEAMLQTPEAM
jgi:hypothetical protein